jgi:hypothetical protein
MRPTRITSLLNSLLTPLASARLTPLLMALSLSCTTGDKAAEDTSNIAPSAEDLDRDGYFSDEDCNDADSAINPGAAEICDGVDNNCDLQVDEGATATWYADTDGDGFGDVESSTEACEAPEGYSNNASDCDDQNADAYPGAIDVCDGVDNNCDGSTDEDEALTWYADADGDTWGDAAITTTACEEPVGYTAVSGDCDDSTAEAWPGHAEVCDEIDNDCDGDIDEDVKSVFYEDRDSDGWGDLAEIAEACVAPTGYSPDGGDCDDDDAAFHPYAPEADCTDPNDYNCDGSVGYADDDADGWAACEDCDDSLALVNPDGLEICNDIDDDCDGLFDDDDSDIDLSTGSTWYEDSDSDAYGDLGSPTLSCDQPTGFVTDSTDCDDDDGHVHPAASEVCNGVDDDCDTLIDDADSTVDLSTGTTWYGDGDTDGYGAASKPLDACLMPTGYVANDDDCNDGAVAINPAALEICDSIDNDCDALIDDADPSLSSSTGSTWYADADTDGYGSASSTTMACLQPTGYTTDKRDCDDTNIAINPAATEICDDLDNDCDSKIDDADPNLDTTTGSTWYRDADSDAFGSASTTKLACDQPTGYLTDATDCNDGVSAINPAAAEICDSLDNDCDTLIDDADSSVDLTTAGTWYRDADGDLYGNASSTTKACTVPSGYLSTSGDCDDTKAAINPAASEICDSLDNDCDSKIDDADSSLDASTGSTWYRDADGDHYGSSSSTKQACLLPSGYLSTAGDCDDTKVAINPAATEVCDSLDNDCDSKIDDADTSLDTSTATKWYEDKDTDGYGITSVYTYACTVPSGYTSVITDCDDTDSTISPADAEYCDGVDNDCDGAIDEADAVDYPCTTVIEDFESGWPRTGWTTVGGWGSLSTTRYEGSYAALNPDWSYYTGAKIAIGDTVGMWIRGGSGRAYLGFDSSSSGTKSFVVAYNTGDIRFQNNASWSYSELNTTSMSIPTGQWLYMAVTLNSTTSATGRLYNSSGTLLGSVSQTYSSISGTGYVAIRSFSTIYIDYIDSY